MQPTKTMKILTSLLTSALFVICGLTGASAQGTEFTYQGRLNQGANPANGNYEIAFHGVELAAIKGLNQKLEDEVRARDAHIAELEKRLSAIENLLTK